MSSTRMPAELKAMIFSFLTFDEAKNIRLVCSEWRDIFDQHIAVKENKIFCRLTHTHLDVNQYKTFNDFLIYLQQLTIKEKEIILTEFYEQEQIIVRKNNTIKLRSICTFNPSEEENESEYEELNKKDIICWSIIPVLLGLAVGLFTFLFFILSDAFRNHGPIEPSIMILMIVGSMILFASLCLFCVITVACSSTHGCAKIAADYSACKARQFFSLFGSKNETDQEIELGELEGGVLVV